MAGLATTIVLVGRTGSGKSATGNSIIGAHVFDTMPSSVNVTAIGQLHQTVLDNDHILNVFDTPGLFDYCVDPKIIGNELAKCITTAKGGVHAIVVVVSLRTGFSREEGLAIETLNQLFGGQLFDYMIVVLSHGDALGRISIDDYLDNNCPESLMSILEMCGNRYVLFDNVTEDELKKSQQKMELFRLVGAVVVNNGGITYSKESFVYPPYIFEYGVDLNKAYEDLLLDKIELRETTVWMEKQLADEQAARKQAEAMALEAQQKSIAEMSKLSEQLEILQKEAEEQRKSQIESEKKFKEEQSRRDSQQKEKFNVAYEDQLLEMESKHREMMLRLEKQLEVEVVARAQAEAALMKSNEEIRELRETLLKNMMDEENQKKTNNCAIFELTSAIEHKIESNFRETSLRLENQLADKFARRQAEDKAEEAQRKLNDEISKLREDMEKARRHMEDTFAKIELRLDEENQKKNSCTVSEITSAIEHQIESNLREKTLKLENQLANEKVARLLAEDRTREVQKKSDDEMSMLRERTMWLEKQLIKEQANRMKSEDEISKLSEDLERAQRGEELQNNRITDSANNILRNFRICYSVVSKELSSSTIGQKQRGR